ncbi:HK97 family phage prohead protease [Alphaproteobacteria bacterium]|nr:HK97 family phage prohead protease [Alphaproteobacteria bacterium]
MTVFDPFATWRDRFQKRTFQVPCALTAKSIMPEAPGNNLQKEGDQNETCAGQEKAESHALIPSQQPGFFSGYASVFGVLDLHGDKIMPGAFQQTLGQHQRQKTQPLMLWQHQRADIMGQWTKVEEDKRGLWVEGIIDLSHSLGRTAHMLLKKGQIDAMSIGYYTRDAERCLRTKDRLLHHVDLHEISLVTFGANRCAWVLSVKKRG